MLSVMYKQKRLQKDVPFKVYNTTKSSTLDKNIKK